MNPRVNSNETSRTSPGTIRLSALVVTFNEAEQIERCLKALSFCDEIVLVDSESTDRTTELARRLTDRIWTEPWRGYGGQKQFALEKCRGEWVLWIDADEVVSPQLAESILAAISDPNFDSYETARRVFYLGDWIRHGGWGADWVRRLFRREKAHFRLDLVHEGVELAGEIGRLQGPLDHYSYRSLSHHWSKIDQFTSLWAEQCWADGQRTRFLDLLFRPFVRWFKIYFVKQGWRDGWRGFVVAGLAATYVLVKYAKLKEKESRAL